MASYAMYRHIKIINKINLRATLYQKATYMQVLSQAGLNYL